MASTCSSTATAPTTTHPFKPSETELLRQLHNKLAGEPTSPFIPVVDLYSHLPPWDIFTPTHPSSNYQEWFCFTPLKKLSKSSTASRFLRSVAAGKFSWDNTGKPTHLPHHHPAQRRLFNLVDRAKTQTSWSMHEYTLSSRNTYSSSSWAVCRVFHKHTTNTKSSSTSTPISTCTSASTSTSTSPPPPWTTSQPSSSSSYDDVIALQPPSKKQCCRPQLQSTPSLPLQPVHDFFLPYVVQGDHLFEGLLFDAMYDDPSDVLHPQLPPPLPPDPDPDPSPAPDSDPDPSPAPDSSPAPDPHPDPSPAPDPDPSPASDPDPDPSLAPDPQLHDTIYIPDSVSDSDSDLAYEFSLDEIAYYDGLLDNGTFFDFDLIEDDNVY